MSKEFNEGSPHHPAMTYANFGQRFMAALIDCFVLLPLVFIDVWVESLSKVAAMFLVIPMTAAFCAYNIYCHGRFGKTVGKHAMGIQVVKTSGERIGWSEAWWRSSVDILFAALGVISSLIALAAISNADYYVDWIQRSTNLAALEPTWLAWTDAAAQVWIWSEVVVMLFNRRRRALHDFIAGTVVTVERKHPEIQTGKHYRF